MRVQYSGLIGKPQSRGFKVEEEPCVMGSVTFSAKGKGWPINDSGLRLDTVYGPRHPEYPQESKMGYHLEARPLLIGH
jgi:hypothetical protein